MGLLSWLEGLDRRYADRVPDEESPWLGVAGIAGVITVAMAVLLVQTVGGERRDNEARDRLRTEGVPAAGTVVAVRDQRGVTVLPEAVRVEFTTEDGTRVRSWLPVSARDAEVGDRLELRYARSDPSVARVRGNEVPYSGRWIWVALGGPAAIVVLSALLLLRFRYVASR